MIYLDASSTTPVLPEVVKAMLPFLTETYGNPASAHSVGRKARQALEDARERTASLLGAFPDEVIFTSGASESNNMALFGLAGSVPGMIRASPVEHPSIMEPLRELVARGFNFEWMQVGVDGVVVVPDLSPAAMIVLQRVNHETGAIHPVIVPHSSLLHVDATQAIGKLPVNFHDLGATTLSGSAHKFGGPKGIGLLLVRRGVVLRPLCFGGHQQQGRRPGTESAALAVGLATALDIVQRQMDDAFLHVQALRNRLRDRLLQDAAPAVVNGPDDDIRQSPYILNISFPGVRGDVLLMKLDLAGVACSTGSACSSGSLLPSPVLQAMGLPDAVLRSAMRFSFSALLGMAEVDQAADRIIQHVKELRHDDDVRT